MSFVSLGGRRFFGGWRVVFYFIILCFGSFLLWDLGFAAVQWDETPHLVDGLRLSRGQWGEYKLEGSRYPPLFDVVTALFFRMFGVSVFSARLVSVVFGVLSVWVVSEFANYVYGSRVAVLSGVFLCSMPGFIWLCRLAMLETMLIFFFLVSLLLFWVGMQEDNWIMWLLSGVTLGLAGLVKYQAMVGGIIMLVAASLLWRRRMRAKPFKFILPLTLSGTIILFWISLRSDQIQEWLYVLQVGSEHTLAYSMRFPSPIFYLIEMSNPYPGVHPVSFPVFLLALLGIGLWLWRRRKEDKFYLTWFFTVYIFFTLITAKNWRYITLVFPVLAVSTADLIFFLWDKLKKNLTAPQPRLRKAKLTKVGAAFFMFLAFTPVIYSSLDVYPWIKNHNFQIPVEEASYFITDSSGVNDSIVILCPSNLFYTNTIKFYLEKQNADYKKVYPYPEKPVDAYALSFNVTELIRLCEDSYVKYVMLYQYDNRCFYQSELTYYKVYEKIYETQKFDLEAKFGKSPRQIFVFSFTS